MEQCVEEFKKLEKECKMSANHEMAHEYGGLVYYTQCHYEIIK